MAAEELRALLEARKVSGELAQILANSHQQRKFVDNALACIRHVDSTPVTQCPYSVCATKDWRDRLTRWGRLGDVVPVLEKFGLVDIESAEMVFDRELGKDKLATRVLSANHALALVGVVGAVYMAVQGGRWVLRFFTKKLDDPAPKPGRGGKIKQ